MSFLWYNLIPWPWKPTSSFGNHVFIIPFHFYYGDSGPCCMDRTSCLCRILENPFERHWICRTWATVWCQCHVSMSFSFVNSSLGEDPPENPLRTFWDIWSINSRQTKSLITEPPPPVEVLNYCWMRRVVCPHKSLSSPNVLKSWNRGDGHTLVEWQWCILGQPMISKTGGGNGDAEHSE